MKDRFNRNIEYLRISVTDLCNLRCKYCMPEEGVCKLHHEDIISIEEIVEIVKIAAKNGIKKIRLTGGEPLVRRGFFTLCEKISQIENIKEICITTNGTYFYPLAEELFKVKVSRVNFSLDTLNAQKYKEITRGGDIQKVLRSIKKAIEIGFKVKINIVLIGGFNDDEIIDFVNLTKDNDIQVRFIELMQIGESASWSKEKFISNEVVLKKIEKFEKLKVDGVADTYRVPGYKGTFGLISPISNCFCKTCNRIRLTSDGKLKPCLHSKAEINLRGLKGKVLERVFTESIFQKPQSHHLEKGKSESLRDMNKIGG